MLSKRIFLALGTVVATAVLAFTYQTNANEQSSDLIAACGPGRKCTAENGNGTEAKKLRMQPTDTYKATVKDVERVQYPNETQVHINVDTEDGHKKVIVGPSQYVNRSRVKLQAGDKVTIKSYEVNGNGEQVHVAQEINKNGNVLKLRNDQRLPVWENRPNGQ